MLSLRAWFSGTTDTAASATPLAPDAAAAPSDSAAPARSARSASFGADSPADSLARNIVQDYASGGVANAATAVSPKPPRKRSWRDVVASAAGFASSSATHYAAAAESDTASATPAIAPLLRSTSSMSSDVSLISGRSVSPFTLSSSSDDFRSDDDEDGEIVADLLAADSSADLTADFDLAEEELCQTDDGEEADVTAEHTAEVCCQQCLEYAAFQSAEAQYEASSLGALDFQLRSTVSDVHGRLRWAVSFPFGKAHGLRVPREQQAMTCKKRELARKPKDTEKASPFYTQRSYNATVALQRASGTCDDCARIGERDQLVHHRRRGCNCALKERRELELQRRNTYDQLKPSHVWPSDPSPPLPVPYELTNGKMLQLRSEATVGDGSCNAQKRQRKSSSAQRDPSLTWSLPDEGDSQQFKSTQLKIQRAATRRRTKQTEAVRSLQTPRSARPVSGPTNPSWRASKRYLADSAKYTATQDVIRSASLEGLRRHLLTQLQSQGSIDAIRSTHDATLRPVALHLAPVDPAAVRLFMHERTSDAPYQRMEPCYSLTATPSQITPWMRAWSDIQSAANPPLEYDYKPSDFLPSSCRDLNPNRRHMLIGLGIRRHVRPPVGSPPVPELLSNHILRGGSHQGCISRRRVFPSWAVILLPLFVLEYEVQPLPLDLAPSTEPISKHLAQRMLSEKHSRRKLVRRVPDNAALPSCLFDGVSRDDRWEYEERCCGHAACYSDTPPHGPPHDSMAMRLAEDLATHRQECDALQMEAAFLERSLIVQSQTVAPAWDERRSSRFRRSAGIYN